MNDEGREGKSQPEAPGGGADLPRLTVGIGASAGGLEALEHFFASMPEQTGMSFIIVTHLHRDSPTILPDLLRKRTSMPVSVVDGGEPLKPDHVYLGPPGKFLCVENGSLRSEEPDNPIRAHHPIDALLRSIAADQKERAVAVLLSGSGRDGTLGAVQVKAESGLVLVQDPESARFAGLPRAAIDQGAADFVLPPDRLAQQLVAYARGPFVSGQTTPPDDELAEPHEQILRLLREGTGHDFSNYKPSTLRRRIERRMAVHHFDEPAGYTRYLQEAPHEVDLLFRELLISVTSFFRDPAAFDALAEALERMLRGRPDRYILRVWTPGCATGEESYSIAILIHEVCARLGRAFDLQLFGTDLDGRAVEAARTGIYPAGIAVDVSPARLERYFVRDDISYRVGKDIRERIVFAVHNVIRDPPFTKLDLVVCRNVLIYMKGDLQKQLVPIFHYALLPGGIMLLGPSETIGGHEELFDPVDRKWKIFRRRDVTAHAGPPLQIGERRRPAWLPADRRERGSSLATAADGLLIGRFAPPSVVMNDRGDVFYIHGQTGRYLEPAPGEPSHNIYRMARPGLREEIGVLVRRAAFEADHAVSRVLSVERDGATHDVEVSVSVIDEPEQLRNLILVSFREPPAPAEDGETRSMPAGEPLPGGVAPEVSELHRELEETKDCLRSTVEELEASNEELRSANEEMQSTNEELQSTNEELETSKEEMQSLNEELHTVNTELQGKINELSLTSDDMKNLLNSTDIGTLFVDNRLRIKRFTRQVRTVVKLIEGDIGRPLSDLAWLLEDEDLASDAQEVLRTLSPLEREVRIRGTDGWVLMRILPYRTAHGVIEGLVITFVDITELKAAEQAHRRLSSVFRDAPDAILLVDAAGTIQEANVAAERLYGFRVSELRGRPFMMLVPTEVASRVKQIMQRCRQSDDIGRIPLTLQGHGGGMLSLLVSFGRNGEVPTDELIIIAMRAAPPEGVDD